MYTDIHALSGIRTHDPSVRAGEDSSCLRPRCHCDRLNIPQHIINRNTPQNIDIILYDYKKFSPDQIP
jgi:hypothetical protein